MAMDIVCGYFRLDHNLFIRVKNRDYLISSFFSSKRTSFVNSPRHLGEWCELPGRDCNKSVRLSFSNCRQIYNDYCGFGSPTG